MTPTPPAEAKDDLVEQLRAACLEGREIIEPWDHNPFLFEDAADEITRLRALVEQQNRALEELGWSTDLDAMPAEGRFEALQQYSEVFRHVGDQHYVICPSNGRMFVPIAWRAARAAHEAGRK